MGEDLIDGRCGWVGRGKPFYEAYHDYEWGVPVHDDRLHFEMLVLEGMQAGLSWEIVLRKREAIREAFHGFVPEHVAAMEDNALEALAENPDIIRNRMKIRAARTNARVFLDLQREFGAFDSYVWPFVGGAPRIGRWRALSDVPCETTESRTLSKDLKMRGMCFVGPVIIYSYMQACGLVNDHLQGCRCAGT